MEQIYNFSHDTLKPKNDQLLDDIDYNLINLTPYDVYYLKQIRNIRSLAWVIFVFGIFGNISILMIFLRKSRLSSSNALCFSALAISDCVALTFMLLRSLLKLQVLGNITFSCRLVKYVYYSSLQISSWCLVLLTLDRLIAVVFIFKYSVWSKKLYSLRILIGIVLTILLLNSHLLFFVSSKQIKNQSNFNPLQQLISEIRVSHGNKKIPEDLKACHVDPNENPFYYKYFYSKWDIAHAIIYGVVPFVLVFISNILIIWKLYVLRRNKLTKSLVKKEKIFKVDPTIKSIQITVMLLSVAILFLLFTSPISIYMAVFYENLKSMRSSKKEYIKVVLRYLGYFNNAINFYVYISLSTEFRKEFVKTIRYFFKCLNVCKQKPTLCTTSTTLESTNSFDDSSESGQTKPKRLIRIKKANVSKEERYIKQKTLSSSLDALETFKENTKSSKLVYYKNPNLKTNLHEKNMENSENSTTEPFINHNPTYV